MLQLFQEHLISLGAAPRPATLLHLLGVLFELHARHQPHDHRVPQGGHPHARARYAPRSQESDALEVLVTEWFAKDDAGYLAWLAANPDGFVLNTWIRGKPAACVVAGP